MPFLDGAYFVSSRCCEWSEDWRSPAGWFARWGSRRRGSGGPKSHSVRSNASGSHA